MDSHCNCILREQFSKKCRIRDPVPRKDGGMERLYQIFGFFLSLLNPKYDASMMKNQNPGVKKMITFSQKITNN